MYYLPLNVELQVLSKFSSFCFVYNSKDQFTTLSLIYPLFHQFTTFMCGLQIIRFILHLLGSAYVATFAT